MRLGKAARGLARRGACICFGLLAPVGGHGQRLVGLALVGGVRLGLLRGCFLGFAQGSGFRFGLALGGFLGDALRYHRRLIILPAFGLASRFDIGLQLRQFSFGFLARLSRILELDIGPPLGFGFRFGALSRLLLQLALLRRQGVGPAPLGQCLFELLGRQGERRRADRTLIGLP